MHFKETTCKDYNIGDIVPYINTHKNIRMCKIQSFSDVGDGVVWFNGFDIKTLAKVFYPVKKSIDLNKKP